MRFNVDVNSEFCNTPEKIENQEKYKKFITDLHNKCLKDTDWPFINKRTID